MDYSKELAPEVREKMKKNLVYVGITSIVMLFAGLTSAYYVSMGGGFWLKYPMPTEFYISTVIIALSSLTFVMAIRAARNNSKGQVSMFLLLTFGLGIAFVVSQFLGYRSLVERGIHFVNKEIIITEGKYGSYFEIKYKGNFIQVDGNDYKLKGKLMTSEEFKELQNYMNSFKTLKQAGNLKATKNKDFEILLRNEPLVVKDKKFYIQDSTEMEFIDQLRLSQLAINIVLGRGDFVSKGKYGKDFVLYFKGKKLDYQNRTLVYNGTPLSTYLQIKASETTDNASAFLYILTCLHVLHLLVALFYLLRLVTFSFSNRYTSDDHLSLKVGSIFWHFLGLLWLYLLVFLIFIH